MIDETCNFAMPPTFTETCVLRRTCMMVRHPCAWMRSTMFFRSVVWKRFLPQPGLSVWQQESGTDIALLPIRVCFQAM